ncbi:MAG: hypothetical protein MAG795_00122 [Candidatus Woesearchaeota archaeon]|nr:hypothetical protein [Candidatus Woesearchaeota archaeon]
MSRANSDRDSDISVEILIPSSIFLQRRLSFLESIVVYLKEIHKLTYAEIARQLNRDQRNIWTLYNRAAKKLGDDIFSPPADASLVQIPISVLRDRSLSILETVVFYLRVDVGLKNSEIAELLNRSSKTIWTVYDRAKKKKMKEDND